MDKKEFIILLQKHTALGLLAYPYYIEPKDTGYIILEKLSSAKSTGYNLTEAQLELVKIAENFNEQQLFKIFAKKKKTVKDFFAKLDMEYADNFIKPYLEKNISHLFNILRQENIRCFIRTKKELNIYDTDEIKVLKKPAEVIFNFHKTDIELRYYISIQQDNHEITLTDKSGHVLSNDPCWLLMDKKIYFFKDIDGKKLLPFFSKTHISIEKKFEKKYFETFIKNAIQKYKVNYSGFEIKKLNTDKKCILTVEKDLKGLTVFIPKFKYGDILVKPQNTIKIFTNLTIVGEKYIFEQTSRDFDWEKNVFSVIEKTGLLLNKDGHFIVKEVVSKKVSENLEKTINWLNNNQSILKAKDIIVQQDFFKKKFFTEEISLDLKIQQKSDWFDIYGYAIFGKFKIPFLHLKNNILTNNREFILPNGEIAILPIEWFSKYSNLFTYGKKGDKETWQIKKIHYQFLEIETYQSNRNYAVKYKKLIDSAKTFETTAPKQLNCQLRPYQIEGYSWLLQLQNLGFGACLADDMGLGKTIQTLAMLQKTKENSLPNGSETKNKKPISQVTQLKIFEENKQKTIRDVSLIVMPTSLVHNWFNEIKAFAPNLKVKIHIGGERKKNIQNFSEFDIILTTYGVVRNDIEILQDYDFYYIILDESQMIKNPHSKTYKALLQLTSSHKLVLTGTPIENSLTDLWAQMNFINSGLLGSLKFFKEEFLHPIEKQADEDKQLKLNRLINPFLLRRTKEEVVAELPPVSQQTIYCAMTDEQKAFYESEKSKTRNIIIENIENNGVGKNSIEILQALNKLRQLAIHPVMYEKSYKDESGKFNEIVRNIESVIAENHKILIFSSFVKHLNLYVNYFDANKIKYSYLTGDIQQKEREKVISEFKTNKENNVFLISLKAGGVGLNLTEADYVFIVDPWWNPAAEWQALSRAHRIGQNKQVFVYRYISAESIEEKIANLQKQKTQLADMFVKSNNPLQVLSKDEIAELFV
ncbi:MAG: DEAD/DEAH box helicase [Chlorobi bacterium]|nr:DEAD/DEAH box helicase [Chlorobiota bacterium]